MPTFASKDGTTIAYDTAGSGPPVVLVDGAFCFRGSGVTPKLMPLLSRHFTVYAYDRRGRGESGDTRPYAVEREIEDLQAVAEVAGGSPHVLAFSSGAGLALRAVARGLEPTKLALYEPPYVSAGDADPERWRQVAQQIRGLVSQGRRGDAVHCFMTKVFGAPALFVLLMKWMARGSWASNESVAHTLPYDIEVMGAYSLPAAAAAAVTVPTAVIGGEKSPAKLRAAVCRTADAIAGAKVLWLPKQGHNVKMDVLTPVVAAFFNG